MSGTRLTRSDITALGVLALLVAAALMIPWSQLLPQDRQDGRSIYRLANIRFSPPRPVHGPPQWRADAQYTPGDGMLLVKLSHRHNAPAAGLGLRADFSSRAAARPAKAAWLAHVSGPTYGAAGLRLERGDWVMSLTGSRHSELLFRIEQSLRVD